MDRSSRYVVGAGLLALDVVIMDDDRSEELTYAGGTCGNVLSILSYLDWNASAVGHIGNDQAGRLLLEDLSAVGVRLSNVTRDTSFTTPVFLQRIYQDMYGSPRHDFSHASASDGSFVPAPPSARYLTTPIREFGESEHPDVFFMDRLSADILALAGSAKSKGAVVFYEPSVRADQVFWDDAFAVADIVKYSADRFESHELMNAISHRTSASTLWEVQTLGSQGLKYRDHQVTSGVSAWKNSPAIPAPRVVDTCGAGDWCSAGLLYGLLNSQNAELDNRFGEAIKLGQAWAAWACAFVGARGAMYGMDISETWQSIHQLVDGAKLDLSHIPSRRNRSYYFS